MSMVPFDASVAGTIASWPVDGAECRAWCSLDAVVGHEVVAWSEAPGVEAWVISDDGRPVAYGETWVDDDEKEVELAHLIVAPDQRGAGAGRRMVVALSELAVRRYPTVVMRVRPDNVAARRCYAAAGFERVSVGEERDWNVGQPIDYVWMRLAPIGRGSAPRPS